MYLDATVTTIVNLISSIGFPAVMTLLLLRFMSNILDSHKEERKEMMKIVEQNTEAINNLASKF